MTLLKPLFFFLCLATSIVSAETLDPVKRGYEIAKESEQRDNGWGNFSANLIMILKNRQGGKSIRKITSKTMEVPGGGDKSLLIFQTPLDVKNTAFLSHSYKTKDADQWLYLPALKRVKRISSSNKGGSFMGSEFSYEDMSSRELEKYSYKYIRDDTYKGRPVFVVEQTPNDARSLYSKMYVWVDQKEYIPWKFEYFNRRGKHLKTLIYRKYKKYLKQYWRPDEMYMINLRTKKSTILGWKNYRFRTNISKRSFNPRSLAK
ncbi:MAG: outer membrane lipoprotein-sorting protein [Piscirickettsiaceae bacterium]|nr:MAG: outer membrane lipoprotein-sorting protein [Piscirickettsiaceae bacterium]